MSEEKFVEELQQRSREGRGNIPETEKILGEKWSYFPWLYITTGFFENRRKWLKNQFPIEIFLCKS